jgi:transposase
MSLHAQPPEAIPELTRRIARTSFPKGSLAMHLRDALGPIYQDVDFAQLFPERGRAAVAPWRLALVTVLQAIENLSDRQAAEMVRVRLDWKYALSLPMDDEGFDASSLMDFRQRLLEHHAEDRLLEQGLLKAGGKQRTDATMVLATVGRLNSLESVWETLRALLNELDEQDGEWLLGAAAGGTGSRGTRGCEEMFIDRSLAAAVATALRTGQGTSQVARWTKHYPLCSATKTWLKGSLR